MYPAGMALFVVVIPAAVAAAALLLARLVGRGADRGTQAWLAISAGFVAGYVGIAGVPKAMPVEAWHWLLPIALLGAVVGAMHGRRSLPRRLGVVAPLVLLGFAVVMTLLHATPTAIAGYVAAAYLVNLTLDGDPRRTSARSFLSVVLVVAIGTAVSLVVSGTMLIGHLAGALAAATGACIVLAGPLRVETRSAVPLLATLLVALWMNGILYAELPIGSAALLASAPLACWIADIVLANRLGALPMAIVRVGLAIVLAGAGVAVAVIEAPPLDY
jgi:hypothetical protein